MDLVQTYLENGLQNLTKEISSPKIKNTVKNNYDRIGNLLEKS